MNVSIIIPSYNESANISRGVLQKIEMYLKDAPFEWELLLTDDGSSDGTLEQLQAFVKGKKHMRVLALPHRGKGPTVIDGLLESTGDVALFTDFDQATPLSEIEELLPYYEKGFDIVVGSREVKGAKRKKEPLHRHIMGKGFNVLVQMIAVRGIQDTQCGFKLFSRKAVRDLCPRVVVYGAKTALHGSFTGAFDVELLYLAQKFGYRIAEEPVLWTHVATNRVSPLRDSLHMLVDIIRIRLADLSGKYPR